MNAPPLSDSASRTNTFRWFSWNASGPIFCLVLALLVFATWAFPQDAAWSHALTLDPANPASSTIQAAISVIKSFGRGQILVLVALLLGAAGRRKTAIQILVAGIVMMLVVTAIKHGVGRVRPNLGPHSFPSGDTATAFAMAIPMLVAMRAWWLRTLILCVAVLVGLGRVVEGWHFPSDVAAGAAVGCLSGWSALCFTGQSWWKWTFSWFYRRSWRWWLGSALIFWILAGFGVLIVQIVYPRPPGAPSQTLLGS